MAATGGARRVLFNCVEGFPIHDGLLNERGRGLIYGRVVDMTGTRLTDLRGGTTHEF